MTRTTAQWLEQAKTSLLADDWLETERCLRAAEQTTSEEEQLLWKTLLARLRLLQGRYEEGDNLLGSPFFPQSRALARLRESFYAARHWRTPHLVLPIFGLEEVACAYMQSNVPEGPFLDLAHWEMWFMHNPSELEDASITLLKLMDSHFSGNRLMPSNLEALLAEAWYAKRVIGLQSYPRKMAIVAASGQQEFGAVNSYIRLLEALHVGDKTEAATSCASLYSEAGICLWLRCLPLLEELGDNAQREHIVFQLERADGWLGNVIGIPIEQSGFNANVRAIGNRLSHDVTLSNRCREQWHVRLGLKNDALEVPFRLV